MLISLENSKLIFLKIRCNYDPPGNYINEELANVKVAIKKDSTPPPVKTRRKSAPQPVDEEAESVETPAPRAKKSRIVTSAPKHKKIVTQEPEEKNTPAPRPNKYRKTKKEPKPNFFSSKTPQESEEEALNSINNAKNSKKETTEVPQNESQTTSRYRFRNPLKFGWG